MGQSLRIELIHALHRRGGVSPIVELSQEPRVQSRKTMIGGQKKMTDFIKMFSTNFEMRQDESAQIVIQLKDTDVMDQSMIPTQIVNPQGPWTGQQKNWTATRQAWSLPPNHVP